LEVADAQRTVLSAERIAAQINGQQLATSVALIRALGGGWVNTRS
jgi:multidrug efflux system outer membrane protein